MLYKKYVIEIVCESNVLQNISTHTNSTYENQIQINLYPIEKTINVIKFLAEDGTIQEYGCYFDTYKEAFDILSTHYYNIKGDINVLTIKIISVLDDLPPPPDVLRAMKIKNILE